ncbi:putative tetratricopeptide-like helical domain superfamily [Helianthus annuus]|nr:putative tetratricopeptide-like helical domain superfamily [Helianthus annuus]KAJ0921501.1 putative tetratricopeptide-like helical domain superfamily [Helianthus annuus]
MRTKMANQCLNISQHSMIPHSPSPSLQTLASAISSPSSKRRSLTHLALAYRYVHRSAIFGTKLNRSETPKTHHRIKRSVSAQFSDEEFSKQINELALRFQVSDDVESNRNYDGLETELEWQGDMIPASIERKANSVDLPFSLRIIKRKKQCIKEAGESAYCSVKKAFSSMVFIIRELQSYTLQMREVLYYEDLQHILVRVQKEMNASFVWLFQQVFSQTPTLMVYVMILLANYSVHSMSHNFAIPAETTIVTTTTVESVSETKFDSSSVKTFVTNSGGKTTSVGGNNNGGGGNFRPVASGTDGDGRFDGSVTASSAVGDQLRTSEESVSGQASEDEELESWNSVVEEADRMQNVIGDDGLDRETMKRFVSPVTVKIEEEDVTGYFKTELLYQTGLSQEPDNPLLLANYAQFLYLVARDYDRAEDYFKRAYTVEPKDAEALNKYASFLWQVRKDLWAAEETYLEAISADPNNSFYAANYAHFLWSTGGEDTCFPLDSAEDV